MGGGLQSLQGWYASKRRDNCPLHLHAAHAACPRQEPKQPRGNGEQPPSHLEHLWPGVKAQRVARQAGLVVPRDGGAAAHQPWPKP